MLAAVSSDVRGVRRFRVLRFYSRVSHHTHQEREISIRSVAAQRPDGFGPLDHAAIIVREQSAFVSAVLAFLYSHRL